MGLSRTVSEINGDFSWKSQNFPTPVYCAPPLKGFPLELGTGAGGQKARMMELSGWERSLTMSSSIWIQCTNVTNRQTDGRTDTGRQQRLRLRIASRGKKSSRNRDLCYSNSWAIEWLLSSYNTGSTTLVCARSSSHADNMSGSVGDPRQRISVFLSIALLHIYRSSRFFHRQTQQ